MKNKKNKISIYILTILTITALLVISNTAIADRPHTDAGGPYTGYEGDTITFIASDTHGNAPPLLYKWDFDNDGTWDMPDWKNLDDPYTDHIYCDDYHGFANLIILNNNGYSATDLAEVDIYNVAPTVYAGPDIIIDITQTLTRSGYFEDPGWCDIWTATVDYGEGAGFQPLTLSGYNFDLIHTYMDFGVFTVTVMVEDDDGGVGIDFFTVTITCIDEIWVDDNAPPSWYDYAHVKDIQTAVDRICPGGIIHVLDGNYKENVIVWSEKTDITIIGEDVPTDHNTRAVIDGSITINACGNLIKYLWFNSSLTGSIIVNACDTVIKYNVFEHECHPDSIGVIANMETKAEYNYWGFPNGPNGGFMDDGTLADGYGVQVFGDVDVEPWIGVHAKASASSSSVDAGENIIFKAAGSWTADFNGKYKAVYYWEFGDGHFSNEKNVGFSYSTPGTYEAYVRVRGNGIAGLHSNFMYDWDYLTITVNTPDPPLFANTKNNNLGGYNTIIDELVQIFGTASGGAPPYTYTWDIGDGRTVNEQNPEIKYNKEGTYTLTLTVTDTKERTAQDTTELIVNPKNQLTVNIHNPDIAKKGLQLTFSSTVTGGTPTYNYNWNFGDESNSNKEEPAHTYYYSGEYTIILTVTDSKGMTKSDTYTLSVEESNEYQIITNIKGGKGITAKIHSNEKPINWNIKIKGFVLFEKTNSGTVEQNTIEKISLNNALGIGRVTITISTDYETKKLNGFMLGSYILIN